MTEKMRIEVKYGVAPLRPSRCTRGRDRSLLDVALRKVNENGDVLSEA